MTATREQNSRLKTTALVAAIAVRSQGNGVSEFIKYMDGLDDTPVSRWWIKNCERDGVRRQII